MGMELMPLSSWTEFKTTCVVEKGLNCQYRPAHARPGGYDLFGPEEGFLWVITIIPGVNDDDIADFEANYKADFNGKILPVTGDGLPQTSSIPGVDPKYACFCQGVSKRVSISDNVIEWQNTFSSVQLMGITVQAKGFDAHDKLLFEVGYYAGPTWVQVSGYGLDMPLVVDPFFFHKESCRVSLPIPQGLTFRVVHTFSDPQSTKTPDVGIFYHLQRPYAA